MSVSKRLSLLVVSELVIAAFMVVAAVLALERLSEQHRYMHAYVFAPLLDIESARGAVGELRGAAEGPGATTERRKLVGRLRTFIDRYQRQWLVEGSTLPEAVRFRGMLARAGRLLLIDEEREAADAFRSSLGEIERAGGRGEPIPTGGDPASLSAALGRLDAVNLRYLEVAYDDYARRFRSITLLYIVVGLLGTLVAPLLGFSVRHAIAPRVAVLIEKVRRFRDLGVNLPIDDRGDDELATLARALDVSFAAISARDRERERFLAIAAHELKTPLTTVKGFAQAALAHRDDAAIRNRALAVIDRQATRLARLIQDLLWSARARGGQLSFEPAPIELAASARRVIAEVELVADGHSFPLEVRGDTHMLGDVWLIEQSLSSLLIQAATMAPPRAPVPVTLDAAPASVRFTVEAPDVDLSTDEVDRLMEPFAVLQFEGRPREALRSTGLGLHLAREIARLHASTLRVERRAGERSLFFVLEYGR